MGRGAKLGIAVALGLVVLGLVVWMPKHPLTSNTSQATAPDPADVVQAFEDEGLEVGSTYPVDDNPDWTNNLVPKTYTQGTHFDVGPDQGGQVLVFEDRDDLEVMKKYWENFNRRGGFLYSHVYDKKNAILHINGQLPKSRADQYNEVFQREV